MTMREEFEAWCKKNGYNPVELPWSLWQAAYRAGQKSAEAERDVAVSRLVLAESERDALRADAERWQFWRQQWHALTTESAARYARLDLKATFVDSAEKMDAVTDAAINAEVCAATPSCGHPTYVPAEFARQLEAERDALRDDNHVLRMRAEDAENALGCVKAERDALLSILDGFIGKPPSPLQWKMICEKATEVMSVIDAARRT